MKAVILAGGLGTRISEETHLKPKPMIEVGGKPILWHILKMYSAHGVNDFVICCGYKGYVIKEYFANYFLHTADVTLDLANNKLEVHQAWSEPWRITLVDTGADSQPRSVGGMRCYLDIASSLGALALAPRARVEESVQLHERELVDYLTMKWREYSRQQVAVVK